MCLTSGLQPSVAPPDLQARNAPYAWTIIRGSLFAGGLVALTVMGWMLAVPTSRLDELALLSRYPLWTTIPMLVDEFDCGWGGSANAGAGWILRSKIDWILSAWLPVVVR